MIGIDRSGRRAAKELPRRSALAESLERTFRDATAPEIRGFLGRVLRAAGIPAARRARVFRLSPGQHYRDLRAAAELPMPGLFGAAAGVDDGPAPD